MPIFIIKLASAFVGNRFAKLAAWAFTVLLALLALWWVVSLFTANPKAKARLGANQTEAALESGNDAVNTVGAAGDREAETDRTTMENDDAIRQADGAAAPVAAGVRDAGINSLCKRRAYSGDPKCLQRAAPR